MTNPEATRTFLLSEIESLEPFDLVLVAPSMRPLHVTEVTRNEEGGLVVRVPGRPPVMPAFDAPAIQALTDLGFTSEDAADSTKPWVKDVENSEAAVSLLQDVRANVFGQKPDVRLDVVHGSRRLEHESAEKLARTRTRLGTLVKDILGKEAEQDQDGDFILPIGQVQVNVAARALPDGEIVVRVFAITNLGVQVGGELGLFLARLNFGMMFGRFALDAEHRSIWFDETILGEEFREDEFRFVVRMVATTADGWDDRLKQMFGGVTYQEAAAGRAAQKLPVTKPGEGIGMYL